MASEAAAAIDRKAAPWRPRASTLAAGLGILAIAVLPAVVPEATLASLNFMWLAIVGAVALNLLTGLAGQVSMGTAAFLAIGAFTSAYLGRSLGLGMLVGVPLAGLMASGVGLLIGLPSLRFKGFYLALTTLALHFVVIFIAYLYQVRANGLDGIPIAVQRVGPVTFSSELTWYFPLFAVALIAVAVSVNLTRTQVGRAWIAIRDHDTAAAMIGVDVTRYKLMAFAVSAFMTGAAGSLAAYHLGNVAVDSYTLTLAVEYVAMIIIGGLGSTAGAVLGAVIVTQQTHLIEAAVNALPESIGQTAGLSIFSYQAAAFGAIIVLFLLFEPRGLIAIWRRIAPPVARRLRRAP